MPISSTLRTIRRAVAPRIGAFLAHTATGGTVSSMTDSRHPIKSTNLQEDLFSGKWLLRPDAGVNDKVRIVSENGYNPSTGVIQPDLDWEAPPTVGEVYELHGSLEPWTEMNEVINTALLRCYVISEIAVDSAFGATRHGLNIAAPWLQASNHIRQFGYLHLGESRNEHNPYRRTIHAEPVDDEGKVYIDHFPHTFDHGEVLFVKAIKAAYFACRIDDEGVFGEREGLASDFHEAPVALEWIVAATLVEYWDRYAAQLPEEDRQARAAENRLIRASAAYDTLTAKYLRLPPINYRQLPIATGMGVRW